MIPSSLNQHNKNREGDALIAYFDGLVNASFKQTRDGRTAYYPWGVLGKGILVPDAAFEHKLRKLLKNFYICMLPLVVCAVVFLNLWQTTVAVALPTLVFYIQSARMTRGLPRTDEAMTMRESMANSALGHGKVPLYLLSVVSGVFVLLGLLSMGFAKDTQGFLVGLGCVVLFGACLFVFLKMLKSLRD